jgi:hypothetical protein
MTPRRFRWIRRFLPVIGLLLLCQGLPAMSRTLAQAPGGSDPSVSSRGPVGPGKGLTPEEAARAKPRMPLLDDSVRITPGPSAAPGPGQDSKKSEQAPPSEPQSRSVSPRAPSQPPGR